MAGIYIHIPFCNSKCAYCNFFSVVTSGRKAEFLEALRREAAVRQPYLGAEEVQTIYFGGGTPSLLDPADIQDILKILHEYYNISAQPEVTLEANPDTLSKDILKSFNNVGINRISIGIQSFFDDDLQYLSRKHNSTHARQVLDWAQDTGFSKITMDLIYGIPTLTEEKWNRNLDIFFATGIQHLSAYALTIEAKTALGIRIAKGEAKPVNEDESIRHYEILMERAASEGFIHYEISNFAKPGNYSKHNSLYWLGGNYLGLGPSAHSYNGCSRQWNVSNLKDYIEMAGKTNEVFEKETLTLDDRYNEYVMTSLRTSWGCDIEHIRNAFGERYATYCEKEADTYINKGEMIKNGSVLILTNSGKLFADGIAASLFF